MPLGFTYSSAGDFLPIAVYNAQAGRMYRVDREQINGKWEKNKVDVTTDLKAIFDMANIEIGWINFSNGVPDFVIAPATATRFHDKPSADHRQGFRVRLFSPKVLGGAREFSHTARVVTQTMDDLFDAYLAAPENKQGGLLPIVRISRVDPVDIPVGNNKTITSYRPTFQITAWAKRPNELPDMTASQAREAAEKANGHGGDKENDDLGAVLTLPNKPKPSGDAVEDLDDEFPF